MPRRVEEEGTAADGVDLASPPLDISRGRR